MKNFIFAALLGTFTLAASAQPNVGVGTTTPLYKLHVHGDAFVNTSQGNLLLGYPGADNKWRFATTNGGQDLLLISETPAAVTATRMYMTQSGLIGIGTSTPGATLEVKSPTGHTASLNGPPSSMYVSIMENDVYRGYFGSYSGANEDVDFGTGGGANGKLHLVIQASPKLTIDNTGKVGMGTTSPQANLHVVSTGNSSATTGFLIRNSSGDTMMCQKDNGRLNLNLSNNVFGRTLNLKGGMNFYYDEGTFAGYISSDASANVDFYSSGNLSLTPLGAVTIGTSTAATGYKVSVDGKVICEELKVQLSGSWPDYVFDSKYALLPLDELEEKVMREKHLPGILPASQIELDKGFEVGDMQKRFLEKMEEMYRYMFEMNRENKALKAKVETLTTEVKELKENSNK